MWRAFFFACGIMLIVLGLECIVVDRFQISSDSGLSRLARKFLGGDSNSPRDQPEIAASGANGYGRTQSQFGASRFRDSPFQNTSADVRRGADNLFNLPNHSSGTGALPTKKLKTFKTEDWMPWSLIAAGTIISIYTQSLRPGNGPH